jgi:hypothetical protein
MKFLMHLLHKVHLRPNISIVKYPWGFVPQESIYDLVKLPLPISMEWDQKRLESYEKVDFHTQHFCNGAKQAYITIFKHFQSGDNFLDAEYTTPKLSCALNKLIRMREIGVPDINTSNMSVDILGSWLENGMAEKNDKILGMWSPQDIKRDIFIGALGPEFTSWELTNIRQRVLVRYELPEEGRIDVWQWERQLTLLSDRKQESGDSNETVDWTVSNINGILIEGGNENSK